MIILYFCNVSHRSIYTIYIFQQSCINSSCRYTKIRLWHISSSCSRKIQSPVYGSRPIFRRIRNRRFHFHRRPKCYFLIYLTRQRCPSRIFNIIQFYIITSIAARRMYAKLRRIEISRIIIELKVHHSAAGTVYILIIPVHDTRYPGFACRFRIVCHYLLIHNLKSCHRIRPGRPCFLVYRPSHNGVPGTRHRQVSSSVNVERAVPRKQVFASVADNEEVIP